MESNDWQTVKKKKAFRKSAMKKEMLHCMVEPPPNLCYSDVALDMSQVMQRIHETTENLRASEYWTSCQNCLNRFHKISLMTPEDSNTWKDNNQAQHIHGEQPCTLNPKLDCVCYGLGNFSSCLISLHQLAFLLLLLEKLQIPRCQVYIFDPLFTSLEISVLQKLGMTIVSENEEGKRTVCSDTLFFMLHCGKALYNNLLWKNWSQDTLHKMIIIGNSFAGIEERMLSRILQRDYVYIQKSLKIIEEIPFPDCPQYSDIFNDTSIHWFPMEKLRISPSATWQRLDEPTYQECDDLEIIRNHKR